MVEWYETGDGPPMQEMFPMEEMLADRKSRYGDFETQAEITQLIKYTMRNGKWDGLSYPQAEALEMIVHKIARIVNGDPNYTDSWKDIAGYALRVVEILEKVTR